MMTVLPAGLEADHAAIDRAAKFLRNTQQSGKNLTPWESTPKATKKKWLILAEGVLRAAMTEETTP